MPRCSVLVTSLVLVLLAGLVAGGLPVAAAADGPPAVEYRPPLDTPVVDRFDPPERPWQSGNRGIDYDPGPGTVVRAAADGEVVFAGPVAGALHVTLRHADGLRTSYSFLATVTVRHGQQVRGGDEVGVAGGPVHVGVRTPDGSYLDPEALFAGTIEPGVRLVPGVADGLDPLAERRSLLATLVDDGVAALSHVAANGTTWMELATHYAVESMPATHLVRAADAVEVWWRQQQDCTPGGTAPPPPGGRRIAVVVSGLGTGSGSNSAWEIDTATLGYAAADVVRFSYDGGRAPGPATVPPLAAHATDRPGGADPWLLAAPGLDDIRVTEFDAAHSQQPLEVSAERLEELVAQVAHAEPGVPIDVLAHSQGGVVARLGVVRAGADGRLPDEVENLVTIGSPHQGAPLATAVLALQQTPGGRAGLDAVRGSDAVEGLDDRLASMTELAETSEVLAAMRATELPAGVRFTSIGASGDLTVPATVTADPQADVHVVVPTDLSPSTHGDLASLPATTREVALAVADAGPTCQSLGVAVMAFTQGEVVRVSETYLGAGTAGVGTAASGAVVVAEAASGG